MKNAMKTVLKAAVAGLCALTLLCGMSFFYYNLPIRVKSKDGTTDYTWEKNVFYSQFTEGFAWGKTDMNGYNNPKQYDNISILLMGSSQFEGHNVSQTDNFAYLFNQQMEESGKNIFAYNIGTSGHEIYNNAANLSNALEVYHPSKYIVIELSTCVLDLKEMQKVLSGDMWHYSSYDSGILYYAQKVPYFKLAVRQLKSLVQSEKSSSSATDNTVKIPDSEYIECLNGFLNYMKQIADKSGVKLVFLYHPGMTVEKDATVHTQKDENREFYDVLKTACCDNGIDIIDMADRFVNEYNTNHLVAYGFSNTRIGTGHLNKYGHRMVADELIEYISESEAK